jgi:Domain of unknown function (DUF6851)/VCPO second helical-bundle domain
VLTRSSITIFSLACLLITCFTGICGATDDGVVLQWNNALLQAVRNTGFPPMRVARGLAIVHTCMYDAWAAYDPVAVGTQLGDSLRRPIEEHTQANKEKAVSFAAYRALVDLFPGQQSPLFDPLMSSFGYDPSDTTTDTSTPQGIGNVACAAVIQFRHADGSNQLGDINGGAPYSDYTGYAPVNDPFQISDPNRWQPLLTAGGTAQVFLAPHWGLVTPFALITADELRPKPPAQFGTNAYEQQAREVVDLSSKLNDQTKAVALYWADGPNTETPPGHWNLFAQFISHRDAHTLDEDVKMFFILGNAMLDVSIAVWECKRFYDYIRPISAVRYLYAGQQIQAWGGPGQGTQTISGENFRSYIPTPPFAEYTSGHSAFSSASAEVLRRFTGSDSLGASFTVLAGSSFVEPGFAPLADVTLSWATFTEAAVEAGLSRRYGGIHFKEGDLYSRKIGRQIGARCIDKAQTYFNGTAS